MKHQKKNARTPLVTISKVTTLTITSNFVMAAIVKVMTQVTSPQTRCAALVVVALITFNQKNVGTPLMTPLTILGAIVIFTQVPLTIVIMLNSTVTMMTSSQPRCAALVVVALMKNQFVRTPLMAPLTSTETVVNGTPAIMTVGHGTMTTSTQTRCAAFVVAVLITLRASKIVRTPMVILSTPMATDVIGTIMPQKIVATMTLMTSTQMKCAAVVFVLPTIRTC
jgi:hypothetical protein